MCAPGKSGALLLCLLAFVSVSFGEDSDPGERWVGAYGWLQTGENLAAAGHSPLAMGSFIEAHRQVVELQREHPNFEPEMVSYRIERLEVQIVEAQGTLTGGEKELMTKFVDFIDSFEQGMAQRYANEYVNAINTLEFAQVLLDEIIYEKPDEFREAVDTQYGLLQSSLSWLNEQVSFRERIRPMPFVGDDPSLGTTEFVKEEDLPSEGDEILTSADLFPLLVSSVPPRERTEVPAGLSMGKEEQKNTEDEDSSKIGIPGFRMSSRQREIPKPPAISRGVSGTEVEESEN
ncbi:MAG: hypothetical protein AAGC68_05385 [Verrucomicrobiota bacterium]